MNAVILIESRIAGDACEEEGHELDAARPCSLGKQVVKRLRIPGTHVRRSFHLHEKYPGSRLRDTNSCENCLDVLSQRLRVETPQAIVGAGLQHYHIRGRAQHPVDPPKRAGRCLATYAGIDDARGVSGRIEHLSNDGGVRL